MICDTRNYSRSFVVAAGEVMIVTMTEAINEDVEFKVLYAPDDTVDVPDQKMAEVYKADGTLLKLTPKNTPILCNLPGSYRIVQNGPDSAVIRMKAYPASAISRGDIR